MYNLDEKQKDYINQTVSSIGWKLVENMLEGEFIKKPLDINTEGKSNEEIAREVTAQEKTAKACDSFIKRIRAISNEGDSKAIRKSYK